MTAGDFEQVRAIFSAVADPQAMPALDNNVLVKRVVVDAATDQVVMAALARLTVMSHLYVDHNWSTPMMRLEGLKLLHGQMRLELREKGVEHALAELEPAIERSFGRRLVEDFGWARPRLNHYVLEI